MPYVAVPPQSPEKLHESAEDRWGRVVLDRPDLEPAVRLQRGLLTIVIELSRAIEHSRMPRLSLPPKYLAAKLARNVPVFAGEPIPLPLALLKGALIRFCGELAEGGAGEVATHISDAVTGGNIDAGSLLTASLSRDQEAIRTGATHRGLSPDLLWLVAELTVGPVAFALQRALLGNTANDQLSAGLAGWHCGYCPACGSWPALAEVVGGHRTLRCSFCATAWEPTTYACVYCGEEGEAFVTSAPDSTRTDRRVEVCGSCHFYLKTLDLPELSPFPLLSIADLETMELDMAAIEHGYTRPPLKEFNKGQRA